MKRFFKALVFACQVWIHLVFVSVLLGVLVGWIAIIIAAFSEGPLIGAAVIVAGITALAFLIAAIGEEDRSPW